VQDVEPRVSEPEQGVIAVDLGGAALPDSLRRPLDTHFFYSAVESVRATSSRSGTRVTIRLREGAEYAVKKENDRHVIEIQVPAEEQARREADIRAATSLTGADAPSTSVGAAGAQTSEVFVNGSGRRVEADEVFGMGGAGSGGTTTYGADAAGIGQGGTGQRMSIDLQDADIHAVFRFIAEFADVNIIASDEVEGKVTVRMKEVPWDEALGAILQAKGLGSQRFGNILRVAPIDTIKAEQQSALETKKAEAELVDLPLWVKALNYVQAEEVLEQVKSVLSTRGSVQVDGRGNQLIIRDTTENIAQVRQLLEAMDKPNREVDIQARFVEATSSTTRSLGIQWGSEVDASAATGYPTGAFFPSDVRANGGLTSAGAAAFYSPNADNLLVDLGSPSGSNSAVAFSLGSIPGVIDITARLSAMEKEGYGRLVSSPHVRTLDNETSSVSQGARVPFVSVGQGGTQVQFIEAELELDVTPHITADGMIFLDLTLTNNRPDFTQTVQGNPAIQTKEIETRVLVADGDTIVLGGVYATSESFQQNRVPGLGKIPILGYLFRNSARERSQNEMLVFVTPTIVVAEKKE
jgi:type IV pilus assembly protein PilQ